MSARPAGALEVGRVVRAHGLRGQVVVELTSNRPERMDAGEALSPEGGGPALVVESSTRAGDSGGRRRYLVAFRGVADRHAAEALRGTVLVGEPIADPDALWVHEMVGCEVHDAGGRILGTVTALEANPASDLLVLDTGVLVPLRFVTGREGARIDADTPPGLADL